MTCKDCKGTRVYQPLIGPPESCRACVVENCSKLYTLMPLSMIEVSLAPVYYDIQGMVDIIVADNAINCDIRVYRNYTVANGGRVVLALRQIQRSHPYLYSKLVPNNMLNVILEPEDDL